MNKFILICAIILSLALNSTAQSGRRKAAVASPTPTTEQKPTEAPRISEPKPPPVTAEKNQDYRCTNDGTLAHLMDDPTGINAFEPKEVDTRAQLLTRPEPKYTEDARRVGARGVVILKVLLSAEGTIDRIRVLRPLPFGLTESAIRAACALKFKPAIKAGQPVSQWMKMEYGFSLAKSSIFGP
jgi:TonB family protein